MAIARYFGGKGKESLQKWIVSHFPPVDSYQAFIDPFCGLGSILLAKRKYYPTPYRGHREILSDLYLPNIALLIQIRERPVQLVGEINTLLSDLKDVEKLKQWVRDYPVLSLNGYADNPDHPHQSKTVLQSSAEYWLYCQTSFRGGGLRWNCGASPDQCKRLAHPDYKARIKVFQEWSEFLKNVEIRLMDGLAVLDTVLTGTPQRFIYADPPYPMEVRKSKDSRHKDQVKALSRRQYAVEFEEGQHEELRKKLDGTLSLVSSYPSQLYKSLYEGWLMVVYRPKQQRQIIHRERDAGSDLDVEPFENGSQTWNPFTKSHEDTETPECLYLSPALEALLKKEKPHLLENAIRVGGDKEGDKII